MQSGGIWDVLPTLDDIPEGLVFVKDEVLQARPAFGVFQAAISSPALSACKLTPAY
jgi:hypothetical protein